MRIAFEEATLDEMLAAFKGLGFDDLHSAVGVAFNRGCDGFTLTVREVQTIIKQARAWGYNSIEVADPDWIVARKQAPSTEQEIWEYLSAKYKSCAESRAPIRNMLFEFIRNTELSAHVRFCMILTYEGAAVDNDVEDDPELAQNDEYKLNEIADFLCAAGNPGNSTPR